MINYQNSVVDNYPLYQAFIDLYYAYVKQRNAPVGEINNHAAKLDLDRALSSEIDKFYSVYAIDLPKTIAYDKRNLAKILNQIYEAKGTENSLKLLFRLIYNEDIQISYPVQNILKPSDGRWIKEQYFTAYKYSGTPPIENTRIVFSNEKGDFSLIVTGVEIINADVCRIRFSSLNRVNLPLEQIVTATDGEHVYFIGKVIPSPDKLRILKPGKYWKKGKAIVIPGSIRNTVAVVSSVSTGGVITGIEILEYGIGHNENQISIISPFPRKPTGSLQDLSFQITAINTAAIGAGFTNHPGVVYHHTVNIEDYVDGLADEVIGISAGFTHNSYFLSDYLAADYLGTEEIHTNTTSVKSIDNVGRDTDIRTWQESLALLMYEHGPLVDVKGKYSGDEGQLSNQLIKIQDSYFYQAFSYLLESIQDPKLYKKMADLFHPAGTKRFSGYIKQIDEALQYEFRRAFLVDTIVLRDQQTFLDADSLIFVKKVIDSSTPVDSIRYKIVVKQLTDSVTPNPDVKMKNLTKNLSEITTYIDVYQKTIFKSFTLDSVVPAETEFNKDQTKYFTTDFVTSSHTNPISLSKPRVDTTTITDPQYSKIFGKGFTELETIVETKPKLTTNRTLNELETILEAFSKNAAKNIASDLVTIVSTDSNGTLVDGRWDVSYSIGDYSEPYKYLSFS
jgi:hypothetical protein